MTTITVKLSPDVERKLQEKASRLGQTLEAFLEQLAEDAATERTRSEPEEAPRYISDPRPTPEEFDRLLRSLASGPTLPVLPPDFSRADIYDDHD